MISVIYPTKALRQLYTQRLSPEAKPPFSPAELFSLGFSYAAGVLPCPMASTPFHWDPQRNRYVAY